MITDYLLIDPVALSEKEWTDKPEVSGEHLVLPISPHVFPTIPSFIEALGTLHLEQAVSAQRVPAERWEDIQTVNLIHPLCLPLDSYIVHVPADPSMSPSVPKEFREVSLARSPASTVHNLWALWGIDALIDVKGHRVKRVSDDIAVVYTAHAVYRVPIPVYPKKTPAFRPGIFARLPREAIFVGENGLAGRKAI